MVLSIRLLIDPLFFHGVGYRCTDPADIGVHRRTSAYSGVNFCTPIYTGILKDRPLGSPEPGDNCKVAYSASTHSNQYHHNGTIRKGEQSDTQ